MKLQFPFAGADDGFGRLVKGLAIGAHTLDMDLRRDRVGREASRINHHHTLRSRKPNPPIEGFAARLVLLISFQALDCIEAIVTDAFDMIDLAIGEIIEALAADPEKAPARVDPQGPMIVGDDGVDNVVEEAVVASDVLDLVILEPGHARLQSCPDNAIGVFADPKHLGVAESLFLCPEREGAILDPTETIGT